MMGLHCALSYNGGLDRYCIVENGFAIDLLKNTSATGLGSARSPTRTGGHTCKGENKIGGEPRPLGVVSR